ncbi:MAG TPA: M1 family aminopeptidase [Ktedonobacterales bacterium]|nr:M1 family aminopeptidase [Ktedonobacterales bacterium]
MKYCDYGDQLSAGTGADDHDRPGFALPGDQPHYAPDRPADVRHVHIDVALDFERKMVSGTVTTSFAALFEQVREITFDAAELDIQRVTLADGTTDLDHWSEGERLHVRLDQAYSYGEAFGIAIQYAARPRSGLHFIGPDAGNPDRPVQAWTQGQPESNHFWFPCHDFPNDRATTSLRVTVPARFMTMSNGRLEGVDEQRAAGTKTYRWRHDVPHPAYLVTLVVGEFVELEDHWRGVPVNYYVRAGREADGHTMFDKTPAMIEFYSTHFGVDYPYEKYAQIVPELFTGAMENTSATTHSFRLLPDPRASLDFKPDPVVAHELVHQWFGDLLTCRDWGHIWLNETFATYFEMAWMQQDAGEDEYRVEVRNNLRAYLAADARGRRPIVYNVYRKDGQELFDRHVYQKGSVVLHLLRFVLGEEPFWRAIQVYAQRNRGREVITADLERAIEETTGRGMARFFEEWVYGAGHPEFQVTYAWDDEHHMARIGVTQKQAREGKGAVFHTPVDIRFGVPTSDKATGPNAKVESVSFRVQLEEAEHTFYLPLAHRPLLVRFDPGSRVPKTLEFERPADLLRFQLRRDDDVLGRIEAAEALSKLGDPQSVEALARALLDEPFWAVRAAIAQALGEQRSERALDALLAGLKQVAEHKGRRAIAAALGQFRAPEQAALAERAAGALEDLLQAGDPSYFVEAAAAEALGRTRTGHAFDRLVGLLDRPSWNQTIRAGAFAGLGELGEPRAVEVVATWMLDRQQPMDVRASAAAGLATLARTHRIEPGEAHARAIDAAGAALDDPWEGTVFQALGALSAFGDVKAIPAIERFIAHHVDSHGIRVAREALLAIRRGHSRDQETRRLRTDVDGLREDNRKLRERLVALEAQSGANGSHNGHTNGHSGDAKPRQTRARKPAATARK